MGIGLAGYGRYNFKAHKPLNPEAATALQNAIRADEERFNAMNTAKQALERRDAELRKFEAANRRGLGR